jgi:hypothetical protein
MSILKRYGEVSRYADLGAGEVVIVEEVLATAHWLQDVDQAKVRRFEKRVRLTPGEREYLLELEARRAAS